MTSLVDPRVARTRRDAEVARQALADGVRHAVRQGESKLQSAQTAVRPVAVGAVVVGVAVTVAAVATTYCVCSRRRSSQRSVFGAASMRRTEPRLGVFGRALASAGKALLRNAATYVAGEVLRQMTNERDHSRAQPHPSPHRSPHPSRGTTAS